MEKQNVFVKDENGTFITSPRYTVFTGFLTKELPSVYILSEEEMKELKQKIACEAFTAGVGWRNGIDSYGAANNPKPDKETYLQSLTNKP